MVKIEVIRKGIVTIEVCSNIKCIRKLTKTVNEKYQNITGIKSIWRLSTEQEVVMCNKDINCIHYLFVC